MAIAENKALIRRIYDELLESGNYDNIEELIHGEYYDHTQPPGWETDRTGLQRQVAYFRQAFPDIRVEFHEIVAENDLVMHRQTMRGTHLGEFFGIQPTGNRVTMTGTHTFRIKDGKLLEHKANNDDLGVLRQLGAIPAGEPAAETVDVMD